VDPDPVLALDPGGLRRGRCRDPVHRLRRNQGRG
jgi:hypothetical protein